MTSYLRVVRRARWAPPNWTGAAFREWQGDALVDLATAKNTLSVFLVDSDVMVNHVVAALAAKRKNLTNFDYAMIDSNLVAQMNLRVIQQDGDTPHQLANRLHHDIIDLTASNVYGLMQSITIADVTRVPPKRVKALLLRAIEDGHIKSDDLESSLINTL